MRWLSSIYLTYHTPEQVAVGLVIGTLTGVAWFYVVDPLLARTGMFTSPLARSLLIRDYGPISNVIAFEYASVQRAVAEHKADAGPGSDAAGRKRR